MFLSSFSTNLKAFSHECRALIGYATPRHATLPVPFETQHSTEEGLGPKRLI